jgi:hypothetical protein
MTKASEPVFQSASAGIPELIRQYSVFDRPLGS